MNWTQPSLFGLLMAIAGILDRYSRLQTAETSALTGRMPMSALVSTECLVQQLLCAGYFLNSARYSL